jgi:hypothetical protein
MKSIDDCVPDLVCALVNHIKNHTHDNFGKKITDEDECVLRRLGHIIKEKDSFQNLNYLK